jgi:hypothetical protein
MRRRKSFEAPTREEAEALAVGWIHTHPGYRVIESRATLVNTSDAQSGTPIMGGSWTVVLEGDDTEQS